MFFFRNLNTKKDIFSSLKIVSFVHFEMEISAVIF